MTTKKTKTRELNGRESAAAIFIMLFALLVMGDATNIIRSVIAIAILIVDVILVHQAQACNPKKGG